MNFLLAGDWMRPYVEYIPQLLEADIKVFFSISYYSLDPTHLLYMDRSHFSLSILWFL
jgi:hypothetical protein